MGYTYRDGTLVFDDDMEQSAAMPPQEPIAQPPSMTITAHDHPVTVHGAQMPDGRYIGLQQPREVAPGETAEVHFGGPRVTAEPAQLDGWHYTGLSFGEALTALKAGHRVARNGWNGKGMWLMLVRADQWGLSLALAPEVLAPPGVTRSPFIAMKTADGCFVPWLASQTDLLADDWVMLT